MNCLWWCVLLQQGCQTHLSLWASWVAQDQFIGWIRPLDPPGPTCAWFSTGSACPRCAVLTQDTGLRGCHGPGHGFEQVLWVLWPRTGPSEQGRSGPAKGATPETGLWGFMGWNQPAGRMFDISVFDTSLVVLKVKVQPVIIHACLHWK